MNSDPAYLRALITALQGQLTQAQVVQEEHRTPIWVMQSVEGGPEHHAPLWTVHHSTGGKGGPRFIASTNADRDGWRRVARVDPDGTIRPIREGVES